MKLEQRHKKVVKFLAKKRELFYDLRDANETSQYATEPVINGDSEDNKNSGEGFVIPMNEHQKRVYKVIRDVYYKDQDPLECLLIGTDRESERLLKMKDEDPVSYAR